MSGIFGIYSRKNCIKDLLWGTSYLQHRGQKYCGWAVVNGAKIAYNHHKGKLNERIDINEVEKVDGNFGIGVVSSGDRQPVSELSKHGEFMLAYDGNIMSAGDLKEELLNAGHSFTGHYDPSYVPDTFCLAKSWP